MNQQVTSKQQFIDNNQVQIDEKKELQAQKHQENQIQSQHSMQELDALIELTWKNLNITATEEQEKLIDGKKKKVKVQKPILNCLHGTIKPNQFTAILGPSGSGKTTLLNFLSGRLCSPNMTTMGNLFLNGKTILDLEDYSNQMAYVMQDDILLATFTPREAFTFIADLRLRNYTPKQKVQQVEKIIKELGLTECADTKIGNQLIRGISGGERKRASIGVELLTNPKMLFLDEPTTGLDSSTALQVIELLKYLSKKGVTVVSTIHQPSSEIFKEFEKLLLLVRGNIIYQGEAQQAVHYFANQGFKCPAYSNPSDFFMKLMNEEGLQIEYLQKGQVEIDDKQIEIEFQQRLKQFIQGYQQSPMYLEQEPTELGPIQKNDGSYNVDWGKQFTLLLKRGFTNEIRNPMDVSLKTLQSVVFALVCIIVFSNLGDGFAGIQNRNGVLFFLITMQAFGSIQGSLATFSVERPLFLRERLNKSYEVGSYFWGKSLSEFPFHILLPIVTVCIVYYAIGLNDYDIGKFLMLNLICILTYWAGASYGLFLSVIIPKMELAMALVPVLIIPLMVLGGFFVNQNNIPPYLIWIEYISMFKYGFQAACMNEYTDQTFFNIVQVPGSDQVKVQKLDPLQQQGFNETLNESLIILFFLGLGVRIIAVIGMYLIGNPKRVKLNPPQEIEKKEILNDQNK